MTKKGFVITGVVLLLSASGAMAQNSVTVRFDPQNITVTAGGSFTVKLVADIPVPSDVALGHHACFGTLSGWPSRQPPNIEGAVLLLNAAVAASGRRVDFLHIPTLGSAEDAFFAPLENLKPDGARIYMGAIHHLHGFGRWFAFRRRR